MLLCSVNAKGDNNRVLYDPDTLALLSKLGGVLVLVLDVPSVHPAKQIRVISGLD